MRILGLSWRLFGPFVGPRRYVSGRFGVSGERGPRAGSVCRGKALRPSGEAEGDAIGDGIAPTACGGSSGFFAGRKAEAIPRIFEQPATAYFSLPSARRPSPMRWISAPPRSRAPALVWTE